MCRRREPKKFLTRERSLPRCGLQPRFNVRIRSITLILTGAVWLGFDLYLILSNMVLRETRLGIFARFLDWILPVAIHDLVFFFLAWTMLLGWFVLLVLGFRSLHQRQITPAEAVRDGNTLVPPYSS